MESFEKQLLSSLKLPEVRDAIFETFKDVVTDLVKSEVQKHTNVKPLDALHTPAELGTLLTQQCHIGPAQTSDRPLQRDKEKQLRNLLTAEAEESASPPESLFNKGDSVEVECWGTWFKAQVVEEGPRTQIKVHHEGQESDCDEIVDIAACTTISGSPVEDVTQITIGDKLMYQNPIYEVSQEVSVVEVVIASCKIRYKNFESKFDTWVIASDVRHCEDIAASATPSQFCSAEYRVGAKVCLLWEENLYSAVVLSNEPPVLYKVHYDDRNDITEEVVQARYCTGKDGVKPVRSSKVKPNESLLILSGGTWYKSTLLEVTSTVWQVSYEDGTVACQQAVDLNKCTKGDGSKISLHDITQMKSGDKVKTLHDGSWYDCVLVEVLHSAVEVRYEYQGLNWDTWCSPDVIKPRSRQCRLEDCSYEVDDRVLIFWAGSWFPGKVLEPGPNISFWIHYPDWEDVYDESVDVTLCTWRNGSKIEDASMVKVGDDLRTLWGGDWYDCVVLDVTTAVCKVRYDSWGSDWDTWCTPDEVKPDKPPPTDYIYKVDERVSIFWGGMWYPGKVLEGGPNITYKIHYDGWGDTFDENFTVAQCTYRDGSKITDPLTVTTGAELKVLWGTTWYDGVVLEVNSSVCKIHYEGWDNSWDTWCTPDQVRPVDPSL